jgi:hypothetical protein
LAIGTLFTLFVVPSAYLIFAADHSHAREPKGASEVPAE